jgi:transcriptional regulator with XRE-family HTH domain
MDYMQLGNRIREVRVQKRLTQQQLSEMAGLSPNYISTIERAKGVTSLETLVNIANALETPIAFLLQDSLAEIKADTADQEIENLLRIMTPKEKAYVADNIKLFRAFCRNLVDNFLK